MRSILFSSQESVLAVHCDPSTHQTATACVCRSGCFRRAHSRDRYFPSPARWTRCRMQSDPDPRRPRWQRRFSCLSSSQASQGSIVSLPHPPVHRGYHIAFWWRWTSCCIRCIVLHKKDIIIIIITAEKFATSTPWLNLKSCKVAAYLSRCTLCWRRWPCLWPDRAWWVGSRRAWSRTRSWRKDSWCRRTARICLAHSVCTNKPLFFLIIKKHVICLCSNNPCMN